MKLILYQAPFAITEIDFVPGPFSCQIEQQHLDLGAAGSEVDFGTRVVKPEVNTIQVHPRVLSTFLHRYRRRQSAQADGSTVVSLCRLTRLLLLHGNWQLCDTAPTCDRTQITVRAT